MAHISAQAIKSLLLLLQQYSYWIVHIRNLGFFSVKIAEISNF